MRHFDECNIKAWEGAENPPPWCNCQTVAEIGIRTRSEVIAECITVVEEIIPDDSDSGSWEATIAAAWLRHAVKKLRDLEDK